MKKEIVRLVLIQMTLVIYSVLGVAVLLKVFRGSPAPDIFARDVRDWGFLFLFASAGWCAWASFEMSKPGADHHDVIGVLASGWILAGVIALIAFIATVDLASTPPLTIKMEKPQQPSISNRQLPPDS